MYKQITIKSWYPIATVNVYSLFFVVRLVATFLKDNHSKCPVQWCSNLAWLIACLLSTANHWLQKLRAKPPELDLVALVSLPHFFHRALWCTLESCTFLQMPSILALFSSLARTQKQQMAITDFELLLYVRAATPTLPLTHKCLLQGCRNPGSFVIEL